MTTNTVKHTPDAREWQDISTAPKDGTDILLGFAGDDRPAVIAGWFGESGWEKYDCLNLVKGRPTHWMPLPPAPQEKGR